MSVGIYRMVEMKCNDAWSPLVSPNGKESFRCSLALRDELRLNDGLLTKIEKDSPEASLFINLKYDEEKNNVFKHTYYILDNNAIEGMIAKKMELLSAIPDKVANGAVIDGINKIMDKLDIPRDKDRHEEEIEYIREDVNTLMWDIFHLAKDMESVKTLVEFYFGDDPENHKDEYRIVVYFD